ncbi:MAG: hypothetical protein JWQ12_178 [Glaciihabitans sp.]|nr:hypothetical protein [Glaciihabitans sp.]
MSDVQPPVPPAQPPVPPLPERPRFGEYAPGFGPGATPAEPVVPPTAQPVAPQGAPPLPSQAWMAPPMANAAPAPYQDSYPKAPAARRPRRLWDTVLSAILLVLGLFGALIGISVGTHPQLLAESMASAFAQNNFGSFTSTSTVAPIALIIGISHAVLYVIAVGVTIPLLVRRRIAFWVPLAAGVIAAACFWIPLMALMASDPAFTNYLNTHQ